MAKNLGGLNFPVSINQGGTGSTTTQGARDNLQLSSQVIEKTASYTALLADRGFVFWFTGAGTYILSLDAAATLLDGWSITVRNDSATSMSIDPNAAELINGAATLTLETSQSITIFCDGFEFITEGQASAPGVTGANTALSNLTATAINASLVSDTDGVDSLGAPALRWLNVYTERLSTGHLATDTLNIGAWDVDGAVFAPFITLTANSTPACLLRDGVEAFTQLAGDSSDKVATTLYCDDYVPLAGGTMTGNLILNADPTLALGAVTKQYVDAVAAGFDILSPCTVATTATLTATYANGASGVGATLTNSGALAAFSSDGVSPAINSRILVKDQASTFQNGIYTLTTVGSGAVAWVLTRATDYDQVAEIFPGNFVIVNTGTLNATSAWIQTATVATIGTDAISFSQFGAADYAPKDATYIVQTASGGLSNEQVLSVLTTGLVKNTTATGVLSIGVQGTDYYAPGGTDVALADGGTNASLVASNGGIFYSTASVGAILAGNATARKMLQSGASTAPAWSTTTWPATTTINRILYSSATSVISEITTANSAMMVTSSAGVPSFSGTMTNGQIIIGSTGATPVTASLTAGAGITITPAAGSIIIAASGSGTYVEVTGTTQAIAANTTYCANNAGLVTLTLPATAVVGDSFEVLGKGAGGWKIAQNASQFVNFGSSVTTAGVGGSLASTNQFDCIKYTCTTANNGWIARSAQGSLTVV